MAEKKNERKEDVYCVRCFQKADEKDKYCIKCGAPLINRCSEDKTLLSKGCNKENRKDAAFCAACGAPTIFNLAGLVPPIKNQTKS